MKQNNVSSTISTRNASSKLKLKPSLKENNKGILDKGRK